MAKGVSRDRRRESQWRQIISEHGRSGLSIREFCRKGKLRETAFYFWRRELQRRQVEGSTRRAEQEQRRPARCPAVPAFVAVRVEEPAGAAATGGRIEVELSGGRRVHVTAPVDRQTLADVLAVLEGRPC
jgi:hypothetical protein